MGESLIKSGYIPDHRAAERERREKIAREEARARNETYPPPKEEDDFPHPPIG